MSEKYSTHVIELIRNNGITQSLYNNEGVCFLMFDYFDLLIYKELKDKDKQYLNYFSLGNVFKDDKDYKVSYKTLSLYGKKSNKINPFLVGSEERLTDTPFLGIIQISLCKENFLESSLQQDIDGFLTMCEEEIINIVKSHSNEELIYQLYRSSTTGDFCLVIRSDAVEEIYNIALTLSDSQNKSENRIKMLTYTNVGIECRILENGCYGTLSKEFVEQHSDIMFSLRFSADVQLAKVLEKYQQHRKQVHFQKIKGLFGRYDYLLHIDLKEFSEIYPVLCEKKLGRQNSNGSSYVEGNIELSNILNYPYIRNINERILVSLKMSEEVENEGADNEAYYNEIINKNKELYNKILDLKKWSKYYQCEYRTFQDLYRGMMEIYKTFSPIGMEKEAYINWLMFYSDMAILCTNINQKMKIYESLSEGEEEKKRIYRIRLLKDWRMNIKAINKYTRLVQNINYQTYQSPVYEIQTQIDTAKTMVAYREAMDNYIGNYVEYNSDGIDDQAKIVPIAYPDLSKDKVEVEAPFLGSGNVKERHILCTVPSFEYFGRLYDLLPWLLHEASHHIRILGRKERNEFVAEYILEAVLNNILDFVLPEFSNNILYMYQGLNEQMLTDSIIEVAKEKIISVEKFDEYGFEEVVSEIRNFLNRLFQPSNLYRNKKNRAEQQEIIKQIFKFLCDEYRKEELLTEEKINLIVKFQGDNICKNWNELKMDIPS